MLVEAGDGGRVEARRDSSDGENHFAEGGAVAQQLKSDLRVRKLAQGLQDVAGFADTFLSVCVAELRGTHRAAEKLEVAISNNLEVRGKGAVSDL